MEVPRSANLVGTSVFPIDVCPLSRFIKNVIFLVLVNIQFFVFGYYCFSLCKFIYLYIYQQQNLSNAFYVLVVKICPMHFIIVLVVKICPFLIYK